MQDQQAAVWLKHFPLLSGIEGDEWNQVLKQVKIMDIPAGETIYHIGDHCQNYVLVIDGAVRVQMFSENGHEIVLYRVEDGQSCILTTSCLLAGEQYQAEAITETPVKVVVFPASAFELALETLPAFRKFVFTAYAKRVTDLLCLINAIAFNRMDVRLAKVLLERLGDYKELTLTHQDIANELGTAREVISRQLKEFERREIIEIHRGRLVVTNHHKLVQLSQS